MTRACEDCGEEPSAEGFKRRTRCAKCGLMVCRWCYHHIHLLEPQVTDPKTEPTGDSDAKP